jgi:hypothetical protein
MPIVVNLTDQGFITLTPGVNVIKLFWHNFCPSKLISYDLDRGYADGGEIKVKKVL